MSHTPHLVKAIKYKTPRHRIVGALLAMGTPVAFMVGSHLKWMESPQKRLRMAVMQGGFWGGMGLSLLTIHKVGFWAKNPIKAWLGFAVAATFPILGFMAARKFNNAFLSPDKDPASIPPISWDGKDVFQTQKPIYTGPRFSMPTQPQTTPPWPTRYDIPTYSNTPYPSYTPYSMQTNNMPMLPFYSR